MNRDDRLFAIIGGTVVTAAATGFLLFAGGITGTISNQPRVRVAPISVAEKAEVSHTPDSLDEAGSPPTPSDAVHTGYVEPAPGMGNEAVRALVGGISAHPQWMSWLVTDDLLYRFVAAVEAVADGYSPSAELGFMGASGPFLVREDEGRLVIAAGTFRRYNLAVDVISSVDADDAVSIFRELGPAIDEARRDVAWHRGDFENRLRQAVDHLLEVEIPAGPIEVERRTVSYAYADDGHERLSGAQRQLLRMGRSNATAVQDKLREIRLAFGWPEAPSAEPVLRAVISGDDPPPAEPVVIAEVRTEDAETDIAPVAPAFSPVEEPSVTAMETPEWAVDPPSMMTAEEEPDPGD